MRILHTVTCGDFETNKHFLHCKQLCCRYWATLGFVSLVLSREQQRSRKRGNVREMHGACLVLRRLCVNNFFRGSLFKCSIAKTKKQLITMRYLTSYQLSVSKMCPAAASQMTASVSHLLPVSNRNAARGWGGNTSSAAWHHRASATSLTVNSLIFHSWVEAIPPQCGD